MPAFISLKRSLFFLFFGIAVAAGMAFLLNFLLSGPKLSLVYDFFVDKKQSPPVSREILIIKTDEFIESSDLFSVLMTLTEMEASNLILTTRVAGSSSPITGTEADIRMRFLDEFNLLVNNIRNLFHGIRSGSIPPVNAPAYVERLVELTENSRDRLLGGLINRDEDLFRSIDVFGSFIEVETRPKLDWDGKIRRVRPVETESLVEHPVYTSLKNRYAFTQLENSESGFYLILYKHDGSELTIPLDKDGNILISGKGRGFRSIDIMYFQDYEEALRNMRRLLRDANELGALSKTLPEQSPLILDEYALMLREIMLMQPNDENRTAWIMARASFIKSLNDFLYGTAEYELVSGYNEVIADEDTLGEEGLAKLAGMRDEIINIFFTMREYHEELIKIYSKLKQELAFSLCIIGPQNNIEYSALLANTLITGVHIIPADERDILFCSFAVSFIILLILFRMRPSLVLLAGFGLCLVFSVSFAAVFIFTSYWIDPIIVFCTSFSGVLVIYFCRRGTITRRARRFRTAYGSAVSRELLRDLISRGRPQPSEVTVSAAAVIVIRDFNLLRKEDQERVEEAGKSAKEFYAAVKNIFFNAGAVIAGFEGDTVIACFGSTLDKKYDEEYASGTIDEPVAKAYKLLKQLLNGDVVNWRFGMDCGKCTFSWSPEAGFIASGRPVVRAKILASKNGRYNTRALITDSIREETNLSVKKIGSLYNEKDSFFELSGDTKDAKDR
jgi:hypothetical protein